MADLTKNLLVVLTGDRSQGYPTAAGRWRSASAIARLATHRAGAPKASP